MRSQRSAGVVDLIFVDIGERVEDVYTERDRVPSNNSLSELEEIWLQIGGDEIRNDE